MTDWVMKSLLQRYSAQLETGSNVLFDVRIME
jgi:hypothetical protein